MVETKTQEVECFLEPCGSRIVVLEDAFKEPSSIIITPDSAKRRTTTGRILRASREALDEGFVEGDRVLYAQFSGTGVTFRNKLSYRILSTDEVLCKILSDDEQLSGTAA